MTNGSDTLSFAYNESGLRTSKTVNGVTHSYVWQGSKLAADITDTYALYFHYDSSGEVIGFTVTENGVDTEYFYVKNLQGDILSVISVDGTEAAAYTYDAWGKPLTAAGDLADINPLRYRGYYYDTETGLYYLQSRYYDAEVCRFINADAFASTDADGVLSANMFAYCENNPVRNYDTGGMWTLSIYADVNATLFIGFDIGIGISFDGQGGIAIQWYYSHPFDGDLVSTGVADVGASIQVQYTESETVDDLNGISSSAGFSAGSGLYVGADAVSNKGYADSVRNPEIAENGVKIYVGYGCGFDIHAIQTYTKTLFETTWARIFMQNIEVVK